MKTILDRAESRGFADHGWLKTYHTFSFADYYNPLKMEFGALRVLNDDTVAPTFGFDTHPHRNMEVISIPLSGYLRHVDSTGNSEVITPGDIQVMSAGSGILHSEYNDSETEDLHFLQIWVYPKVSGSAPHYFNYDIRPLLHKNDISLFLSPTGETPASILQDAWFSWGDLDKGRTAHYELHLPETRVYLFVISGVVKVGGEILSKRDGIGIWDVSSVTVEAEADAVFLLMEVPE